MEWIVLGRLGKVKKKQNRLVWKNMELNIHF
jgi:hypothetical protein